MRAALRSGHFAKMVHNGIRRGLMAAHVEGLGLRGGVDLANRLQPAVRHGYSGHFQMPDIDAEEKT